MSPECYLDQGTVVVNHVGLLTPATRRRMSPECLLDQGTVVVYHVGLLTPAVLRTNVPRVPSRPRYCGSLPCRLTYSCHAENECPQGAF